MPSGLVLLFGGLAGGIGHVFSGPDHLAAVLPFAVASPKKALRIGVSWGLGHGLGVAALGGAALLVREWIDIDAASRWAELAVGMLLLFLGAKAIRSSRLLTIHDHPHDHGHHQGGVHSHPHVHFAKDHDADHSAGGSGARTPPHGRHQHSAFAVGAFHGIAGTAHLVTILPAVASGIGFAALYLASYLAGAVAAMALFAVGAKVALRDERHVPRALGLAGVIAVVVGAFWVITSWPAA